MTNANNTTMTNAITEVFVNVESATGEYNFAFETQNDFKKFLDSRIEDAQNDPNYKKHYTWHNRNVIMYLDGTSTIYRITK